MVKINKTYYMHFGDLLSYMREQPDRGRRGPKGPYKKRTPEKEKSDVV